MKNAKRKSAAPPKRVRKPMPAAARNAIAAHEDEPLGHFKLSDTEEIVTGVQLAKYQLFVAGVVEHGNLTQASIDAGMLAPTAVAQKKMASRLMQVPIVGQMLRSHYQSVLAKAGVSSERLWGELAHLSFYDIGDIADDRGRIKPLGDIPEATRRAITSYKVKVSVMGSGEDAIEIEEREVRMASKDAPIDKLLRLMGMVKDEQVVVSADELIAAMNEGRRRAIEHAG